MLGFLAPAALRLFFGRVAGNAKSDLSKIPPKVWLFLAIAAAIALAVWWIDRRGYQRAEEQERLHKLERQELTRAIVTAIDGELDQRLATITAAAAGKIQTIDTEGKTVVQPIITREILRDRSLTDPNRCLSPGLLAAVNAARGYLLDERLDGAGAAPRSASAPGVPDRGQGH